MMLGLSMTEMKALCVERSILCNGAGVKNMQNLLYTFLYLMIVVLSACSLEETSTGSFPSGSSPPAPKEIAATAGDRQATIQWKSVSGTSSYNLYWSTAKGVSPSTGTKIAKASSPYMHTGLTNGATYFYVVTAVNPYGESVKSEEAATTLNDVPSAPAGVVVTGGPGQASITWNPVAKATSYHLYWSSTRGVLPSTGMKVANVSSPYVHTGLTNGATYYYIVTAVNTYGESVKSEEVAMTLNDAPSAPAGISAAGGEVQVTIAWNPVEKATSYNIYWSNEPNVKISGSTKIQEAVSPHAHRNLSNNQPYYYVATAVNKYGESVVSQEVSATPRIDASKARIRVVWVQDVGDGSDVDALGGNLRLMGFDTGDDRGERVILGASKNYAKPLISPRGDRVVFSDRTQKKIYVVNWDGSGLRELIRGFALAVWKDPRDGAEWIYYGPEETWLSGGAHCPTVYRTLLDSPGSGQLVWNKTSVSVDSFQLSADGRMAAGNFPWPGGGVAQLPNQSWTKLGSGCWTALSPDNSYAFWIFDSQHRNLFIDNISGEQGRWVDINGAPGIDGYEVYHPRWSNHPRVMAMTGPYKVGTGTNLIAGGGPEVEIYVGRFNSDFTAIENWWKVTSNNQADFFPDVWLSP
jgi:fibronectin type 3 domain-containing protein